MTFLRTLTLGATLATAAAAFAHGPAANTADWTAKMDQHMTTMRDAHDKMSRATTPEERQALMNEQMMLMQNGMGMMGGMGPGATGGAGMGMGMGGGGAGMAPGGMGAGAMGSGAKPGRAASTPDMATRQHLLEKRMEMMQSMMQTMLDTMPSTPAKK